ncbi:MAG TPA: CAP domain-containing protein [Thermodesulfobacteriota bacterium]|nr:CAP domain-containing protein [Thermodesulfobacteriota bacterium]
MQRLYYAWVVLLLACAAGLVSEKGLVAEEGAPFLSAAEQQIVQELNRARQEPRSYAEYLKDSLRYYEGKDLKRPGEPIIQTQEGRAAVEEAIRYLEKANPVGPLTVSKGMSQAAKDLVQAEGKKGAAGHVSPDKSGPAERVNRYGRWEKTMGENLAYGPTKPREVVASLIVDDGVPDRGHRKNIFNPAYHVVGVACGPHSTFRNMCVMDFAGGYKER